MKSAIIDKYRHMSTFTITNFVCLRMKLIILGDSRSRGGISQENDVISDINY